MGKFENGILNISNRLKWTLIKNPQLLMDSQNWHLFGRIEFLHFCKVTYNKYTELINISSLFALPSQRMFHKFPQFRSYIIQRLCKDADCDEAKVSELSDTELELAFGELICLDNAPLSLELEELKEYQIKSKSDLNSSRESIESDSDSEFENESLTTKSEESKEEGLEEKEKKSEDNDKKEEPKVLIRRKGKKRKGIRPFPF